MGIEEILETVLIRIGLLKKIMILGDYAEGIDSGHIEILIIGDKINKDYLKEITPKGKKNKQKGKFFYFKFYFETKDFDYFWSVKFSFKLLKDICDLMGEAVNLN